MSSKKKKQDQPQTTGNGDQTAAASTWNDELMTTKQLMKLLQISRTKAWELVRKASPRSKSAATTATAVRKC